VKSKNPSGNTTPANGNATKSISVVAPPTVKSKESSSVHAPTANVTTAKSVSVVAPPKLAAVPKAAPVIPPTIKKSPITAPTPVIKNPEPPVATVVNTPVEAAPPVVIRKKVVVRVLSTGSLPETSEKPKQELLSIEVPTKSPRKVLVVSDYVLHNF
jgi:hypothetical protein